MSEILGRVICTANLAVQGFQERAGGRLDYSISSFSAIEDLLAEAVPIFDSFPEDIKPQIVQQMGSYVLEVGRKAFGGVYYWDEADEQPVLVVGEPDAHIALKAWSKVRGRIKGDSADNIPFHFEGFAEAASAPTPGKKVLYR